MLSCLHRHGLLPRMNLGSAYRLRRLWSGSVECNWEGDLEAAVGLAGEALTLARKSDSGNAIHVH